MPKFLIKFAWEAIIDAVDEEDAEWKYWEGLEQSNETIETIAADSITIKEIK